MSSAWIYLTFRAPGAGDGDAAGRLWSADGDPAAARHIRDRNAGIGAALAPVTGPLRRLPHDRLDAEALAVVADDALPPEAVLDRLGRWTTWEARPAPFLGLELELYDAVATVSLRVEEPDAQRRAQAADLLDALADRLSAATGLVAWDLSGHGPVPGPAGHWAMAQAARQLDRVARTVRNDRLARRAGPAMAGGLTLLAVAGIALTLSAGLRRGAVPPGAFPRPQSFVTERALPPGGIGPLVWRYELQGQVDSQPVTLRVFRDSYIRAAAGARFPVVPTGDPVAPYALLRPAGVSGPMVPLGFGRLPLGAVLIAAAGAGLWWALVGRRLRAAFRGAPVDWAGLTRAGMGLIAAALVAALIAFLT